MRKYLYAAMMVGALAMVSGAARAGTMVVIAASKAKVQAGDMIDGAEPLTLEEGASLTLVSSDGRTVKLSGPYEGAPDPQPGTKRPELLSALSEMVKRPRRNTSSGGIMRAGLHEPKNPWVINSETNGWFCSRDDEPIRLWRPLAVGDVQASLEAPIIGRGPVTWSDGGHDAAWPEDLPLRDGATYRLRFPRSRRIQTFTMRVLPNDVQSDAGRVAWMYRAGCLRQAQALLRQIQG